MTISYTEGSIELFNDFIIINNTFNDQPQATHILFAQLSFVQVHNFDSSSNALSSIEFIMKDDIKLQYLPSNKIYFESMNECSLVFNKIFNSFRTYKNNRIN